MRYHRARSTKIKFIPLVLVGIGIYVLSIYSPVIKIIVGYIMHSSSAVVLGEKIEPIADASSAKIPPLKEKVTADVAHSIDTVKETGLQLKVGDIIKSVTRLRKVADDVHGVGEWLKTNVKKAASN